MFFLYDVLIFAVVVNSTMCVIAKALYIVKSFVGTLIIE